MRRAGYAVLLVAGLAACGRSSGHAASIAKPAMLPQPDARLVFADELHPDQPERAFDERALVSAGALELIAGYDPYYRREKRFWALALAPILRRGFQAIIPAGDDLATSELVLRAKDGYAVPIEAARLLDGSAYLAVADADVVEGGQAGWEPIGDAHADAAPFYLVWKGGDHLDLVRYPRPWALGRIERTRFEHAYAHTVPIGTPAGSPAQRGYAIFQRECVRCHAINREGGRVGPELNVPRSILEYWPAAQIRAYVRDPESFRYGTMPAHPGLSDEDLDGLVAYFEVMRRHKHDPGSVN